MVSAQWFSKTARPRTHAEPPLSPATGQPTSTQLSEKTILSQWFTTTRWVATKTQPETGDTRDQSEADSEAFLVIKLWGLVCGQVLLFACVLAVVRVIRIEVFVALLKTMSVIL